MAASPNLNTEALQRLASGDARASDELFDVLYDELRRIASRRLRAGPEPASLETTELVHEAYVRLVDQTRTQADDRAHFCALAAQVMRRILVDRSRMRCSLKRGGGAAAVSLAELDLGAPATELSEAELLALHELLAELGDLSERQARIVEFLTFGGLTHAETGVVLNVSESTVKREWRVARAWLRRSLARSGWSITAEPPAASDES